MTVHVAAGIICREGRVLAARRANGSQAGRWELPGGKVESGESAMEALRREVREELSCELGSIWHYDSVDHDYPDFHLSMDVFVATLAPCSEPTRDPKVHDELRWLSRSEVLEVEWLEADATLAATLAFFWDEVVADQLL